MTFDARFVSDLRQLSSREALEIRAHEKQPRQVALFEIENQLSPADIYCYFHARFGSPNGFQSFLRSDHSDNLIHWHCTVAHDDGLFDVQGASFRTLFLVSGLHKRESYRTEDLITALKFDFVNHGRGMSEYRKSLEHWIEFVSPYQRLRRSVEQLMEQLAQLKPEEVSEPHTMLDSSDQAAQSLLQDEWNHAAKTLNRAFGICFGIRSMLPVMAESFINLILFCLMRREMRSDERLRENAFRQQIDVRVKSLHLNCYGFSKAVNYADPACPRFHTLINERNDLLHGNISIEKLRFNDLFFSGTVPIFKSYRSMWGRTFEVRRRSVGLPQIQDEFNVVLAFIDYVLSCLTTLTRSNFEQILGRFELGYNVKDDRVGVHFADHMIDFRVPPG